MRLSEFQRAMADEFGATYAGVLMRDHWITEIQGTAQEALDRGIPAKDVWLALCADLQVPKDRWHGRGLLEPEQD